MAPGRAQRAQGYAATSTRHTESPAGGEGNTLAAGLWAASTAPGRCRGAERLGLVPHRRLFAGGHAGAGGSMVESRASGSFVRSR